MTKLSTELAVECPCCGATLTVDTALGRVVSHRGAERDDTPELSDAQRILAAEKARRDAIFEASVVRERGRGDALSKRFDEALKQVNQEPIERPIRDFDLD